MKIDNLRENMVLFNPVTKKFICIKEITRINSINHPIYQVVSSGECDFMGDTRTIIDRKVLNRIDLHNYFYIDPIAIS